LGAHLLYLGVALITCLSFLLFFSSFLFFFSFVVVVGSGVVAGCEWSRQGQSRKMELFLLGELEIKEFW